VLTYIYDLFLLLLFFFFKEYKRLEREINTNWSEQPPSKQQHQPQTSGIILSSATAFTEKSPNTH